MIKLIIFDFFDVFRTDAYKAWLKTNSFKREGGFAEVSNLSDAGKITGEQFFERISKLAGREVTPCEMDATAILDTAMTAFARELHKTYRTSLLSNAPSDFVRGLLKQYVIEDIFDYIFISGETGLLKPHPDAFEDVLRVMNVKAAEAIFIDDSVDNVIGARKSGIEAIQFFSVEKLKADLIKLGVSS